MPGFSNPDRRAKAKAEAEKRKAEFDKLPEIEKRTRSFRIAAGRETIEAFAVAFILALLFRVFLAEAFVIPTGSMAPTLMGAHKDILCEQCQYRFRVGASIERDTPTQRRTVAAGICPNCRRFNSLDLAGNLGHSTFNGDRIVVNRYSYAVGDPERWDVIVFKFPGNPKQNYIKRLVGLPNETLTLRHGDVYAKPTGKTAPSEILRKPPKKVLAMSHLVHDTAFQSPLMVGADYPTRWQPWHLGASSPPTDSWKVTRDLAGVRASVDTGGNERWLRYFHRWPSESDWEAFASGQPVDVDPYQSRAVTDFYAYDSAVTVDPGRVYDVPPSPTSGSKIERLLNSGMSRGVFAPSYKSGGPITQFGYLPSMLVPNDEDSALGARDGMHWVGDLMITTTIETDSNAEAITLELVRAGVQFQTQIGLSDGTATLRIMDGPSELPFTAGTPTATTAVRAGGRHEIRMSNYDDQILLWVDGEVIEFDQPTMYAGEEFRRVDQDRPHWSAEHPLDAAPVGIAVTGGSASIDHWLVQRDQYYIATKLGSFQGNTDYQSVDSNTGRYVRPVDVQTWFGQPEKWSQYDWTVRQSVSFELESGQYFPMGDNSPGSLDARGWVGKARAMMPDEVIRDAWKWRDVNYVPRELMVGKAVAIFWPHSWDKPVRFTPDFGRMGLIQ